MADGSAERDDRARAEASDEPLDELQLVEALDRWCDRRKLDPRPLTLAPWQGRLEWVGQRARRPALVFPTAIGVARIRFLDDGKEPKTRWEHAGGSPTWYGLEAATTKLDNGWSGPLYIVNGEPSVWACHQAGVPAVCTCAGEGTTPKADVLAALAGVVGRSIPVRIVYDLDPEGRAGARKLRRRLRKRNVDVEALRLPAVLGEHGDVDDLHRRVGDSELGRTLARLAVDEFKDLERDTSEPEPDDRPVLRLKGDLHQRADLLVDWLSERNDPPVLFCRGRDLVVLATTQTPEGARTVLEELEVERLRAHISARVRIVKTTEDGDSTIDTPKDVCTHVLARPAWPFPALHRILRTPCFGPTGELIARPGYYRVLGALYPEDGVRVPPVPEYPSQEERAAALRLINDELLADFPFADDASRAHALAFFLLFFARPLLPRGATTPIHLVTAPGPRTGKSLLIRSLTIAATGAQPAALSPGKDESEREKRLGAALSTSPAAILIDNVSERRVLDSAILAEAITSDPIGWRRLGGSEYISSPNSMCWAMTGNNPRLSGELRARCVLVRLDSGLEDPATRTQFRHKDIEAWAAQHRPELVHAGLVLVQAWIAEGMTQGQPGVGDFGAWARVMSGILGVAGVKGLLANRELLALGSDEETARWHLFIAAWQEKYPSDACSATALLDVAKEVDGMADVVGDGSPRSQATKLAQALQTICDRRFGQVFVRSQVDKTTKNKRYHLEKADA